MSAGPFQISRYASTELDGAILPIRLQEETTVFAAGVANTPPPGAVTLGLFASVGRNRNAYGVKVRKVTIRFTGTPPDGYSGEDLVIPVLTEAAYLAYVPGTTGTYLGAPIEVVSRRPETVR